MTSHVFGRFYALSIAPLTTIFYLHPGLGAAATAAVGTAAGIKELVRRRKPAR